MIEKLKTVKQALERQTDNMAFLIKRVGLPYVYFETFKSNLEADKKSLALLDEIITTLEEEQRQGEEMRRCTVCQDSTPYRHGYTCDKHKSFIVAHAINTIKDR